LVSNHKGEEPTQTIKMARRGANKKRKLLDGKKDAVKMNVLTSSAMAVKGWTTNGQDDKN